MEYRGKRASINHGTKEDVWPDYLSALFYGHDTIYLKLPFSVNPDLLN